MIAQERLYKYAKLLVGTGCALKKGQQLYVTAPVECAYFVRLVAQAAWELGAGDVLINWTDPAVERLRYLHADPASFDTVPQWEILLKEGLADTGAAILRLGGGMFGMDGVDPKLMQARRQAELRDCPGFSATYGQGKNTKCGAGIPTAAWAKKVFPHLPEEQAIDKLWEVVLQVARATGDDPGREWLDHAQGFQRRTALLTARQFDAVRYTAPNGTDLTVGLVPGHRWHGGGMETTEGVYFFPNMPTEEIFTSPDRNRADGIVHSSLPLSRQGGLIEDFWIRFEHGKAVDCGAKTGEDLLRQIIDTDEGSCHLGEVALVPHVSPISQLGLLFYSTLFDENAACHLALGRCYPFCLEGGLHMSGEELLQHRLNVSSTHVDFMIGTPDMDVTGLLPDGAEVPIFRGGNWAEEFM